MDIVSFSALADFWACPRLYHYRQDLKLPVPMHAPEARREGSWIHQQLDSHAQGHTPPMATNPAYSDQWRNYTEAISPYAGLPCFSEWSCHLPSLLQGEKVWLHGRVDRIYLRENELILLDFKTGHEEPGEGHQLQLDFYAWLLWQAQDLLSPVPLESISARTIWLDAPEQTLERRLDAAGLPDATARFMTLLEALLSSGSREVPAPRSVAGKPWCNMCEYQRLCPEGSFYAH